MRLHQSSNCLIWSVVLLYYFISHFQVSILWFGLDWLGLKSDLKWIYGDWNNCMPSEKSLWPDINGASGPSIDGGGAKVTSKGYFRPEYKQLGYKLKGQ